MNDFFAGLGIFIALLMIAGTITTYALFIRYIQYKEQIALAELAQLRGEHYE